MSDSSIEISDLHAPGWPGIAPRWTSSAKAGVGSAHNRSSLVWFAISHGILNEVYYPRVDQACIRDLGLIITNGVDFFSEEKRDAVSEISWIAPGVPAFRVINTCKRGRYRVEKEIVADPRHDAVLQRIRFTALEGTLEDYRVHVLLAPHLTNKGSDNTAWVGAYKGVPMLMASRETAALALASSVPWKARSAGFVGVSDGWQDLHQHKRLAWRYERAESGNVALVGELDLSAGGEFLLALGFGGVSSEAGNRALSSLKRGFDEAYEEYSQGWSEWQKVLLDLEGIVSSRPELYRASTSVLRLHDAKRFHGGTIASLSIPWGFFRSDDDIGGYHLVWPRDLVETAVGLLAAGAVDDARNVLFYLESIQELDGHWPQNMWLDGTPYWTGVQMDETAFPILLVRALDLHGGFSKEDLHRFWPMILRAATFLVSNGPVTDEDRWEENAGYTPFTLSVEITGLLAAADVARRVGQEGIAKFLEQTADFWNESIEDWLYVSDTELARQVGVDGYYVRIMPPDPDGGAVNAHRLVTVRNSFRELDVPADHLISMDALALVRFGLRAADDPRIVDTVRVIDALLKTDTPVGPCWHRYNYDGYGEHADGGAFDGSGVGRAWPLLVGERAHYEIAAGRLEEARRLLETFAAFATQGNLLPEQVWDAADVPERELYLGKPTGSAMPLVWAHSEYIKLLRSVRDGKVFDMPRLTVDRYLTKKTRPDHSCWRFNAKISSSPVGRSLRIVVNAPAVVHWSIDAWATTQDAPTIDSNLGVQFVDLPTETFAVGTSIEFTFFWQTASKWESRNFVVRVREA